MRIITLLIIIFLLPYFVIAQCPVHIIKISDTEGGFTGILDDNDNLGKLVNIGDLDGDGIDDMAIAARNDDDGGSASGAIYILFMNPNGTVRENQKISDTQGNFFAPIDNGDLFGSAVAGIGDLDNDGIVDIVVTAYRDGDGGTDRGAAYILFLNANGTVKSYQKISDTQGSFTASFNDGDFFGTSVTHLNDIDGDGVSDIAIGASKDDDGGTNRGAVYIIFLNTNGTVKSYQKISDTQGGMLTTLTNDDRFSTVSYLGDLDGDGRPEIAVGATGTFNDFFMILSLNPNGTVYSEQKVSTTEGGGLNFANFSNLSSVGDLDGDGVVDMAIGWEFYNSAVGGFSVLLLNPDGTVKQEQIFGDSPYAFDAYLDPRDWLGITIHMLGDIDGDGLSNISIGAWLDDDGGTNRGAIYIVDLEYTTEGEIRLQVECPADVTNTIVASDPTACLNANITVIQNDEFDLIGEPGSFIFEGAETAVVQWQISYNNTDWENIPEATTLDMVEVIKQTGVTYFRRIYTLECCDINSISNVVTINSVGEAPELSISPLHYCPGAGESAPVVLEVSGGTAPFTYSWSPATGLDNPNSQNPTVTFGSSDVYQVTVTGSDGCSAVETAVMIPKQANAGGTTTYICNDEGVQIGMSPIAGISGITYNWLPTTGLSCTDCSNPIANPSSTTTYILTINDGNGCINSDQIQVVPNAYQADAGVDVYVCRGTDVTIGTPSQADIFYGWSPGLYLDNQTIAQPTFFSGVIPNPNPYIYTLTTFDSNGGDCYSIDTLLAHVAWADAGLDDTTTTCLEPVLIGTPDCCDGQATYEWTVVSGDANSFYDTLTNTFSTTSNIPQPYVLPTTQLTTYQVRVTWGPNADNSGGANCTDLRFIEPGCGMGCPVIDVTFLNADSCGVGTSGTIMEVPLNPSYWNFVWASADGIANLSCTDCANPSLLANVTADITYTLNYTSKIDPSINCFFDVDIYDSNTATPTPLAQGGTACSGTGVQIGNLPVAGWTYSWTPTDGLDNPNSSNPLASPAISTDYTLIVTDGVTTCMADTTISVLIFDASESAGGNKTGCIGETVLIGSPAVSGYTYSWSPTTDLDDPTIAQPTATVNSTRNYTVTVTAPNGCNGIGSMTLNAVSNFTVSVDDIEICANVGGQLSAAVNGVADSDLIYSWSPTTNLSCNNCPDPIIMGLNTTTIYTVTATTLNGNCAGMATTTVTVNPTPTVTLNSVNLCTNSVQIGAPQQAGYTYVWSPAEDLNDANIAQPTSSVSANTIYTITITSAAGCREIFSQTVNVLAPQTDAGLDIEVCEGEAVTIGAIPAEVDATYSWSPTTYLDNPNVAQAIARPESTITYTLSSTKNGCTVTDDITLTVPPKPSNVPTLSPFEIICEGKCTAIGINNNPLYTYEWFPASAVQSPNTSMTTICPTENTTLTLTITDLEMGCSDYQDIDIYTTTGGNCPIYDWGDLPDTSSAVNTNDYQTLSANNGPVHQIITGLNLGTSVDGETDGQPSNDALGDGVDDDGITIFESLDLYPNVTFRLPFSYVNTTGNTAHVEAWIDWNADGDFDDANEMVANWNDGNGALPDMMTITIPATAALDALLGWRIRISHQDNMTPYGLQANGEVEDYLINLTCPQVCLPIKAAIIRK